MNSNCRFDVRSSKFALARKVNFLSVHRRCGWSCGHTRGPFFSPWSAAVRGRSNMRSSRDSGLCESGGCSQIAAPEDGAHSSERRYAPRCVWLFLPRRRLSSPLLRVSGRAGRIERRPWLVAGRAAREWLPVRWRSGGRRRGRTGRGRRRGGGLGSRGLAGRRRASGLTLLRRGGGHPSHLARACRRRRCRFEAILSREEDDRSACDDGKRGDDGKEADRRYGYALPTTPH